MMNWEIRRISTPEQIFDKILRELPQPVGILLFGPDGQVKERAQKEIIYHEAVSYGTQVTAGESMADLCKRLEPRFENGQNALAILDGNQSIIHSIRHDVTMAFRSSGAATIIGIYAKDHVSPVSSRRHNPYLIEKFYQIHELEKHPPTADGLDYLIVVED